MLIFHQITKFSGGKCPCIQTLGITWIAIASKYCTLTLISLRERKRSNFQCIDILFSRVEDPFGGPHLTSPHLCHGKGSKGGRACGYSTDEAWGEDGPGAAEEEGGDCLGRNQ